MLSECKWTSIIHHQSHTPHSMLWNQWKQKHRNAKEHIQGVRGMFSANSNGYRPQVYPSSTKTQVSVFKACKADVFAHVRMPSLCKRLRCEAEILSTSMFVRKDPCLTSRKGWKHLHPDMGVLSVFLLQPCFNGMEIELFRFRWLQQLRRGLNPCYTGMEIEHLWGYWYC